MDTTFETILASILEEYEQNQSQDLNLLIERKCLEFGLSESEIKLIQETNSLLDSFAQKTKSLEKAKQEGKSRQTWLLNEFDNITEGRSEAEKAEIASAISETNENIIEEIAKE